MIRAVVFDVGETLVDETRQWASLAEALNVPAFTLMATVGGLIARGETLRKAVTLVAPDIDFAALPRSYRIEAADLYPDALPCLAALRRRGLGIGIAGNQPRGADQALQACGIDADFVATSAGWGVAKPDPGFFDQIIEAVCEPASAIAYVGDRLDNDVVPARASGMRAIRLRRGPWAMLDTAPLPPDVPSIDSLDALVAILDEFR